MTLKKRLALNEHCEVDENLPCYAPKELWLKIGQSNSMGTDPLGSIDPILDAPDPRVLEVSKGVTAKPFPVAPDGELMPYINPGQDDPSNISFGQIFGKTRVNLNSNIEELAVLNMGVSGSGYARNNWKTTDPDYAESVLRANNFLAANSDYTFAGFLWHQGESDSNNAADAAAYEGHLVDMINGMRSEITGATNAPFVAGTMVEQYIGLNSDRRLVDTVTRNIGNLVPNATVADFSQMTDFNDFIHFGSDSLRLMGEIYAERHQELAQVCIDD